MDAEGASFPEIAAALAAIGIMPHRGKAWYASTVRAVLRSRIATEAAPRRARVAPPGRSEDLSASKL